MGLHKELGRRWAMVEMEDIFSTLVLELRAWEERSFDHGIRRRKDGLLCIKMTKLRSESMGPDKDNILGEYNTQASLLQSWKYQWDYVRVIPSLE